MNTIPTQGVTPLPFHYAGIIHELSEALKHALQAQDWKERPPAEVTAHDRSIQERGNIAASLTHLKNGFHALERRYADVDLALRLAEHKTMETMAPEIARAIGDVDPMTLPPAFRPPEGT